MASVPGSTGRRKQKQFIGTNNPNRNKLNVCGRVKFVCETYLTGCHYPKCTLEGDLSTEKRIDGHNI
jgi:hypothetical protein